MCLLISNYSVLIVLASFDVLSSNLYSFSRRPSVDYLFTPSPFTYPLFNPSNTMYPVNSLTHLIDLFLFSFSYLRLQPVFELTLLTLTVLPSSPLKPRLSIYKSTCS